MDMPDPTEGLVFESRSVDATPARTFQSWFLDYADGPPRKSRFIVVEKKWSQGNPGWARLSPGKGDTGGPFFLERQTYADRIPSFDSIPGLMWHVTPVVPFPWYSSIDGRVQDHLFPNLGGATSGLYLANLVGKGATAISRCAPTQPVVDGAVALGELVREGIPNMVGRSLKNDTKKFKALGSEYLNVEFGWKPFISDLRKLAQSVTTSEDYIKQMTRNSGRDVRRRYEFPLIESASGWEIRNSSWPGDLAGHFDAGAWTQLGKLATRQESYTKTWFSGAFTYHFDLSGSTSWERVSAAATRARHLYGIKLTPDVLWNLMPWSWALDWGANIGDVMSNIALFSNDGLVMRYGYIMEHRQVRDVYQLQDLGLKGIGTLTTEQSLGRETKVRLRATPFGFGLNWDGFSNRQLAIIAALGISRGKSR